MSTLTERSSLKKKIVPYDDYLQLKNAYINLKEKNDKLKEEKQKFESLLKQYQSYIADYKASNNTINLLFKKFEKKFREINSREKEYYKDKTIVKIGNFGIINTKRNAKSKSKSNKFINVDNEYLQKETILTKKIDDLQKNNEIITNEYNNKINEYIEMINQLKKELESKEGLYQDINKKNEKLLLIDSITNKKDNNFKNFLITKEIQYKLINNIKRKDKDKEKETYILSKACEFTIIKEININKGLGGLLNFENLEFISKCCEICFLKEKLKNNNKNELIISSKTNELNIIKIPPKISKEIKNIKIPLSITSYNLSLLNIDKKKEEKELFISPKTCEFQIVFKRKIKDELIIASKNCEYNIFKESKEKLRALPKKIEKEEVIEKNEKRTFAQNLNISSKINEFSIISKNNNLNNKLFEDFEISSCQNEISIIESFTKRTIPNKLEISSNICDINIIKPDKIPVSYISTNVSQFYLINNNSKSLNKENKDENFEEKQVKNVKYFESKICRINLEGFNKKDFVNKLIGELKIESNINNLNILAQKKEKEKEKDITKTKNEISKVEVINIPKTKKIFFNDLNLSSKESEIIIPKINKSLLFKELSITSLVNQIKIENVKEIKKFINIKICQNIQEKFNKKIKEELKMCFKINEIIINPDKNKIKLLYLKKLSIISKANDISIIKASKNVILEISSKVSEINIAKSINKNIILKIDKKELNFLHIKTKKKENIEKKESYTEAQRAILDNYINSINIGFDNTKKYEDYNKINKEQDDEDSDNENDNLECEPVPSFILCIQKKDSIK